MNTLNTTSFTAFIGIDWADAKRTSKNSGRQRKTDSEQTVKKCFCLSVRLWPKIR